MLSHTHKHVSRLKRITVAIILVGIDNNGEVVFQ